MGSTYPNNIINTINLGKECINKTLENKENPIALAQEVKVETICMQNQKKGASTIAVIAARPQGGNTASIFVEDICAAALLVVKELSDCQLTNFAVDGASLETKDVMLTQFQFLDGNKNYAGSVDKKHNVKNHR